MRLSISMTRKFVCAGVVGALCISGLLLTSCSDPPERTTAAPQLIGDELETAVRGRLALTPGLSGIQVDADDDESVVTLSGEVETQALRSEALDAVRAINASILVTDEIDVEPREVPRHEYTEEMGIEAREKAKSVGDKIGSALDDAWIHTKITTKLFGDENTPGRKINVDVENKVVTLRGTVADQLMKAEAERIAKETEGVTRVTNLLKVQPE